MRAQLESKLDGQIANRPAPEDLVKEGILKRKSFRALATLSVRFDRER
jgi:hypothetical protein